MVEVNNGLGSCDARHVYQGTQCPFSLLVRLKDFLVNFQYMKW